MTQPFQFPNGQLANNAGELFEICQQSPNDGIYHLNREDFEKWLDYIGETKLAQKAKQARLASVSDEQRLQQFLKNFNQTSASINGNAETASNPISNFFRSVGKLFAGA